MPECDLFRLAFPDQRLLHSWDLRRRCILHLTERRDPFINFQLPVSRLESDTTSHAHQCYGSERLSSFNHDAMCKLAAGWSTGGVQAATTTSKQNRIAHAEFDHSPYLTSRHQHSSRRIHVRWGAPTHLLPHPRRGGRAWPEPPICAQSASFHRRAESNLSRIHHAEPRATAHARLCLPEACP